MRREIILGVAVIIGTILFAAAPAAAAGVDLVQEDTDEPAEEPAAEEEAAEEEAAADDDSDSESDDSTEVSLDQTGLQVNVSQVDIQGPPFYNNLRAFVSVQDNQGNAVGGLTESDFTVRENGTVQSINTVSQIGTGPGVGISTSLVIDRSGSMFGQAIDDAKFAAKTFVGNFGPNDEGEVIAFNTSINIKQRWTDNAATLNSSIDSINTGGSTNIWGSAQTGVQEAETRPGRSAVIVLSDGSDNSGTLTPQELINEANNRGVPIYTIALGTGADQDLEDIAVQTGGAYYEAADSSNLAAIYNDISQRISNEYEISFDTSNQATDGTQRNVEVTAQDGSSTGSDTGQYIAPCAPLPTASFTPSVTGTTVSFDASASSANGGSLVAYRWDFDNDGQIDANGTQVTHTYPGPGDYEPRLTVEKTCGATDRTSQQISTGSSAEDRILSSNSVSIGGTTEVTVQAQMPASGGSLTMTETFSGNIQSASFVSATVDGQSVSPDFDQVDSNGAVVTLANTGSSATVEYTYEVTATQNTGTISIDGDVDRDGTTTQLGQDSITVVDCLAGIAGNYDDNGDCVITIGELGDAAADYAQGQITIGELGDVASAYAST